MYYIGGPIQCIPMQTYIITYIVTFMQLFWLCIYILCMVVTFDFFW